jgi:hypothetical protein
MALVTEQPTATDTPRIARIMSNCSTQLHRLKTRYQSRRNTTIVQVDAHIWNSFLGRNSGSDIRLLRVSEAGRAPL